MARNEQLFWAPRVQRGLPQRVFGDPGQKRAGRILYSMTALGVLIVGWLMAFAFALLSTQQSASALSDDLTWLKGHLTPPASMSIAVDPNVAKIGHTHHQTASAAPSTRLGCEPSVSSFEVMQKTLRIFAVVPSELPFAINSLNASCGVINVVMPSWYSLDVNDSGELVVETVGEAAQQPVFDFVNKDVRPVELMPIVSIGVAAETVLRTKEGWKEAVQIVSELGADLRRTEKVPGLCFNFEGSLLDSIATPKTLFEFIASYLRDNGLQTCAALAVDASPSILRAADQYFDVVIGKAFQAPWVGSTPQALSSDAFFAERVAFFKENVARRKLIIALGTFSVDWTSGEPAPSLRPYPEVMSALAAANSKPIFQPEVGNSRSAFTDAQGRHHRIWMADAASLVNQLLMLKEAGIEGAAFWSVGYEDPGIWPITRQLAYSDHFDPTAISHINLDGYVSYSGEGAFVAPVSLPKVGRRDMTLDPASGRVTALNYLTLPEPSKVHLYGQGKHRQVVLTFDDGPHPDYTAQTLDILSKLEVPASFFVLGHNALKSPELIKRILSDGHEIGSHTYWHPRMGDVSDARARAEVNSVQNLINGITGRELRLYREPYMRSGGPLSAGEVASLLPLEREGYLIAGMDIVPRDWVDQTAEHLAQEIISQVNVRGGGVVLLHDGGGDQSATVDALPIVITALREQGYEFTSLANYLGTTADRLMPPADTYSSAFQWLSFSVVGKSWSFLELVFWVVFGLGSARAILMLFLTLKRRKHQIASPCREQSATVVIPAFNEAAVIARCLDHVLASDYSYFDVIVVDDGSTDCTGTIAKRYEVDARVTVLSQRNRGKAAALNAALDLTESDVLICIDADSQIHRTAVTHLIGHFERPEIGAVAGRVVVGNRLNLLTGLQALEYITAQSIDRRAKEHLNAIPVVPGAIGAWRTNAVLEAGIFSSETLTEDADMTMAIVRSDYRVIYEEKAIATTEAPSNIKGLMVQRLRWNLGMMQTGWKHVGAYAENRALGLVSLTDLFVFGYLMPLLAPLADLFLVILLVGTATSLAGDPLNSAADLPIYLVFAYLFPPALDLTTAVVAFKLDRNEDRRLLLLFPVQRILYRPILYVSVYRAIWRAVSGSLARWGKVVRVGYSFDHESVA